MKLYTIGFTRKSAQEFFLRLEKAGVSLVLDTRANRTSQLSGFSKQDDLKYFLGAIASISYRVEQVLAPNKALLSAYRSKEIGWDEYARRYVSALAEKKVEEHYRGSHALDSACLLCSEHEPDQCHRRLAAEYLQLATEHLEIIHL